MNSLQRYTCKATLIGICLAPASGAYAQVGSINSAIITPRVWNDIPLAVGNYNNAYPGLITLGESGVSKQGGGYADRDVWFFSNNGGASPYLFQNNDYFNASMSVQLNANDPNIDVEGGWLFSNPSGGFGGDLQFIVKDNGEIVQFGGPSFYGFSANDGGPLPNYVLGQTLILGLNYVVDPNTGMNAFQYSVNGLFANTGTGGTTYYDLGPGVGAGDLAPGNPLGGYFQIQNDPANPNNAGSVVFDDITITSVPEPSTLAFLGLGIVPLLLRRRRI